MTEVTGRTTRAQRMAMPLAWEVVKDLAVEHGACIRPVQLRRHHRDTSFLSDTARLGSSQQNPVTLACKDR